MRRPLRLAAETGQDAFSRAVTDHHVELASALPYEVSEADGFADVVTVDATGTVIEPSSGYPEAHVAGCA